MKNPLQASINDIAQFDCVIDVRSPAEFAHDHIPGAINLPVLDDEQRAEVGTIYKQVSPFEARRVGAAYISENIAQHLRLPMFQQDKQWKPLIYCWRGGMRSGAFVHVLKQVGWSAMQVQGGYKSFRHAVIAGIERDGAKFEFRVISGPTGSGKSALLQQLQEQGAQVLDLEQLAVHRGSVLGAEPDQDQPSQKFFETQIWTRLQNFDTKKPVFVEAESRKIGKLSVPQTLSNAMQHAAVIELQVPLAARIEFLQKHYAHFFAAPDRLKSQLNRLASLCGREQVNAWHDMVDQQQWPELVADLLEKHYDPLYAKASRHRKLAARSYQITGLNDLGDAILAQCARQVMPL